MIDKHTIVEYCNPSFPNTPYYKVDLGDTIYHTNDMDKAKAARQAYVDMKEYYTAKAMKTAEAMAIWMKDEPFKD
jgi:hypothetical protein